MASGYGLHGGTYSSTIRLLISHPPIESPSSKSFALTNLSLPGPSRCFPFWQELLSCYVINATDDDGTGKKQCAPALEDYYECLHHRKEARSTLPRSPTLPACEKPVKQARWQPP